jgi:pyruvate formate lyase activating enzyme
MIRTWKIDYSAMHDGPGIRTSLYLKGCSLRCVWCSNPEGQAFEPHLVFLQSRCIGCGLCAEKCPVHAIEFEKESGAPIPKIKVSRALCDECGECLSVCSSKALEIWGTDYDIPEIITLVEKNRAIYRRSGGGITLTGGDPLFQWESSLELLKQCGHRGIHTVVETSGSAEEEAFERILGEVDSLFMDLKHMDPDEHLRLTGQRNDLILRNVRRASFVLKKRNRELVIRMVVVPGINDGDNVRKAAAFLGSLPYVQGVEFLPYHDYGAAKYGLLNRPYSFPDLKSPSEELMERCRSVMIAFGLDRAGGEDGRNRGFSSKNRRIYESLSSGKEGDRI